MYGYYDHSWQPRKDLDEEVISLYLDGQRKRDARTASRQAHSTQSAQGRAAADKEGASKSRRVSFAEPTLPITKCMAITGPKSPFRDSAGRVAQARGLKGSTQSHCDQRREAYPDECDRPSYGLPPQPLEPIALTGPRAYHHEPLELTGSRASRS